MGCRVLVLAEDVLQNISKPRDPTPTLPTLVRCLHSDGGARTRSTLTMPDVLMLIAGGTLVLPARMFSGGGIWLAAPFS